MHLTISSTIVTVKGKGLVLQNHPKSSGSRQTFRLPQFAVNMLLRRHVQRLEANPYEVIFPSAVGRVARSREPFKQWRKAPAAIGFEWVSPHTFAKSVGTVLANTEGLAAAQRQLGHSSDRVTSKHYIERAHVALDMLNILEVFGGINGSP